MQVGQKKLKIGMAKKNTIKAFDVCMKELKDAMFKHHDKSVHQNGIHIGKEHE